MAEKAFCKACGSELEPERTQPNRSGFDSPGAASGVRTTLEHCPKCGERPTAGSSA
jgi:hypothetical protein